jgi:cytosine/adenosine deaminase-related metal-dependent hydrolase
MSGRLDAAGVLASGAGLALGSDLGAGYEVSMVRVARAMLETAGALRISDAGRGPETVPTAAQAWWRITAGNARALHWPDAGRLAAGAPADLVLVRPDADTTRTLFTGPAPAVDPLAGLLFGWDDRWVERVLLQGRPAGPNPAE